MRRSLNNYILLYITKIVIIIFNNKKRIKPKRKCLIMTMDRPQTSLSLQLM